MASQVAPLKVSEHQILIYLYVLPLEAAYLVYRRAISLFRPPPNVALLMDNGSEAKTGVRLSVFTNASKCPDSLLFILLILLRCCHRAST